MGYAIRRSDVPESILKESKIFIEKKIGEAEQGAAANP